VQTFQGQTQTDSGETTTVLSWDQLSAQTVVNEQGAGMSMQWDNANFEAQNAIESSGFFEPALQDGMLA
jgi:hypothetical protein